MKRIDVGHIIAVLSQASRATSPAEPSAPKPKSSFEEFLLTEYTNIAQAHFNTVDSLANFIKHYIVIASVPVSVGVIFLNAKELKATGILDFLTANPLIPALFLTVVALIGLFVLGYVTNIRCDTLLYARTVNGIRKYFYNKSELTLEDEIQLRTLPRTTSFPQYVEVTYFIFVVLIFAAVGTSYFGAGWYFYWHARGWPVGFYFWLLIGACAGAHLLLYLLLGRHRERGYLRGHIIGVDIDGVLNDHRRQFADILKKQVQKEISPESITRIPVHEIPGGTVTEADEQAVFNWSEYWQDMPVIEERVAQLINKLQNLLGYRVWIFTHRGWPQPSTFPVGREDEYWSAWAKVSWWAFPSRLPWVRAIGTWLAARRIPDPVGGRMIRFVTKGWLRRHNVRYDKLIIERGNTNTTDPLILTRNRFVIARYRKMRAFVEDDLLKAKKLANICEVVFLIDQPYNQCAPSSLPSNLLRVNSWQEIYEKMRLVF